MSAMKLPTSWRRPRRLAFAAVLVAALVTPALPAWATVNPDWDGDGSANAVDCAPLDPAVHPGAIDNPDLSFEDTNCDGIDGYISNAVFVSVTAGPGGNGTKEIPFNTVQDGINAAAASLNPKDVYL